MAMFKSTKEEPELHEGWEEFLKGKFLTACGCPGCHTPVPAAKVQPKACLEECHECPQEDSQWLSALVRWLEPSQQHRRRARGPVNGLLQLSPPDITFQVPAFESLRQCYQY
jgi:hypothetical protein